MHERFMLPKRSIWLGAIITCRRPLARSWKTSRNGSQPSITLSPPAIGSVFATRYASPSETSRSGSKVALARGEVRAAGRFHDAVGHRPVDAKRVDAPLLRQVLGRHDLFARQEALV